MTKRRRIDNTMAKRRRIDNTMAKRRIDNTMAKRRITNNELQINLINFGRNTHETNLIPPLFVEVLLTSQESEQSRICFKGVNFVSVSTIFRLSFGIVPTVWYFLFLIFIVPFTLIFKNLIFHKLFMGII